MSHFETKDNKQMSHEMSIKLKPKQQEAFSSMSKRESIFLTGPAGTGKCLGLNTPIIMFDGSIKMVQDVKPNDLIMGDDSTSRRILNIASGQDEMYKIMTRCGDSYIVNSAHILTFVSIKHFRSKKGKTILSWGNEFGQVKSKSFSSRKQAEEEASLLPFFLDLPILDYIQKNQNWSKYFHGVYTSLEFSEKNLEIDPYMLGIILLGGNSGTKYELNQLLLDLKILTNKTIPDKYKISSRNQRLQLLAGIIDIGGILSRDFYEITLLNTILANDIYFVAKSLGFHTFIKTYNLETVKYTNIFISGRIDTIPVLIAKKASVKSIFRGASYGFEVFNNRFILSSPIKIEKIGINKYYGFEIDGNHRFVLGNFLVTHNTAVIKMFMKVYQHSRQIAVTSTTGTSALLLNGTTVHSYLGIGYGNGTVKSIVEKICSWSWLKKRWIELDCLFIDEISMMDPEVFDKLEEVARIVRRSVAPFGGIQIVLSGDFLQLPCVGSNNFCFEAKCWNKCITRTVYLNEIMRQGDNIFQEVLNKIRVGKIDTQVKKVLNSRIGVKLNNDYGIKPTGLYSHNSDVDLINDEELDILASDGRQFYEYKMDTVVYSGVTNKTAALEKFKKYCTAPEILQLCVGAQVMLLKNLDIPNGLANGSRGVVTSFVSDIPKVRFLNGEERIIEQNVWEIEENDKKILRAQQIPLKVAYAISIHKSQGCSLDYAEIDLSCIFEYGQSYVALSRVKSLEGLSIIDINYDYIQAHPKATAYYESL
jgi:ATP-dependent DNA helicase PIF1